MKLSRKQGELLNSFKKKYLKTGQLVCWNYLKFSKTSKEHQDRVYEICSWLYINGIPFATEVEFKSGSNPDIIIPTLNKIIEVRHSEKETDSIKKIKLLPNELHEWVSYNDTSKPFNYKETFL